MPEAVGQVVIVGAGRVLTISRPFHVASVPKPVAVGLIWTLAPLVMLPKVCDPSVGAFPWK